MQNQKSKNFSLIIVVIAVIAFSYIVVKAMIIVDKRQIGTKDGIYTNCVTLSPQMEAKALALVSGCQNELCKVQKVLDYVTAIPYRINHFQAHKPQQTITNNYGDCDDKSNLLISLLHALGKEAYFVLVPEHIFVITPVEDESITHKKGLWIEGRKYYILESTAAESEVGYPLSYPLIEIQAIIDPFVNEEIKYKKLEYR